MEGSWKDFIVVDPTQRDLGGNLRHGDGLSSTPRLWQALIDRFAPRCMLDVGAGEAHAAVYFARQGVIAHGFDGLMRNVARARHPIALHDLKTGPYVYPCDLALCVEVVEHIEEAHLGALLDTLTNAQVIVMTHALPGQRGHHHVNTQPPAYWIRHLGARGFRPAIDLAFFRDLAQAERPECFFAQSGLIFLKEAEQDHDYAGR